MHIFIVHFVCILVHELYLRVYSQWSTIIKNAYLIMQHCHMCKTTLKVDKFLSKWQFCHSGGRHMPDFRLMVWFLRLKICNTYATDFTRRV
jgi:hypothetical protein